MGIEIGAIGCVLIYIGILIIFINYVLYRILDYYNIDKWRIHEFFNIIGGILGVIGLTILITFYISVLLS